MIQSRTASLVALLVVNDDADADLIAQGLNSASTRARPLTVIRSRSAGEACVALRNTTPDVVILDLTLPDGDGVDTLHRVRDAAPSVPIVVIADSADEDVAFEALRAGAQDYVLKPAPDGPTLLRIVRYACERQHLLDELDTAVRTSAGLVRRWRLLAEVSRTLATGREPSAAIAEIARLIVPAAADCFVLFVASDVDVPAVFEVAHTAAGLRQRVGDPLGADNSDVLRLLGAMQAESAAPHNRVGPGGLLQPIFASLGVASGTAVPVRFGGSVRGFLLLALIDRRREAATDTTFAQSLADRVGMALEQARLLRQARMALAARDHAVSVVSHDLRNPLSTIQICATALLDPEPAPAASVRQTAELIQRSAVWMQQIVQELLDREKLDAGRAIQRRAPIDVAVEMTA